MKAPKGGISKYRGGQYVPNKGMKAWVESLSSNLTGKQKILFDAAKEFLKMIVDDRIYINDKEAFYWALEPSDFVKLVCEKGKQKYKAGVRDPAKRDALFWGILRGEESALNLPGFKEERAARLLHATEKLLSSPAYTVHGDVNNRPGIVYLFNNDRKQNNSLLIVKKRGVISMDRVRKGDSVEPISLHYRDSMYLEEIISKVEEWEESHSGKS